MCACEHTYFGDWVLQGNYNLMENVNVNNDLHVLKVVDFCNTMWKKTRYTFHYVTGYFL